MLPAFLVPLRLNVWFPFQPMRRSTPGRGYRVISAAVGQLGRPARRAGAQWWLRDLPGLVGSLERDWSISVGAAFDEGTEAYVAKATRADGTPAVLKLVVPRDDRHHASAEITVLRLANGEGCARLLRWDEQRGALLLERLGRSMAQLALPVRKRQEILCDAARRMWRPAPDCGLTTGADLGRGWRRTSPAPGRTSVTPARSGP
jgi:streptomycin 6-kinase